MVVKVQVIIILLFKDLIKLYRLKRVIPDYPLEPMDPCVGLKYPPVFVDLASHELQRVPPSPAIL